MTSANVTYYVVTDPNGCTVLETSQHALCKNTLTQKLKEMPNPETLTLVACWPDEEECDHYSRPLNLAKYLAGERLVFPTTMGDELYRENEALKEENRRLRDENERLKNGRPK